ncbi:MAG: flagellar basal-body MS-ring/collar protein FliF [Paracoccaceae bacterium]|jgi:flagellar M-ring protein FliF|nr:flagellar basal-body MS-ring/collar protein FliF [Paracoccaceae bacterium]MDP7186218.1 flagellar basal-body MS-ring/collar protein FliF [Paracoccaceae bacterium]
MQQLIQVWTALDMRRKLIVLGATLAMFAAVIALSRMASAPSMALLYSGLEPSTSGEVVTALEQQNVPYEIRGNAIYVDVARRDALRMTLAAQGLPANGTKGYELLDSLTGFGTTSRMFDAAYWRAKEGELARTIASSPQIAFARVHIANSSGDLFRSNRDPSASVTVKSSGTGVSDAHARALTFLIASSVAGLTPDKVTIMDENGALLGTSAGNAAAGAAAKGQSDELRARILRLVEARVGQGNAVVEVAVDTVSEREEISERLIDPDSLIAISTDTEERSSENSGSAGRGVTVASNLPDGDAANGGGQSREQDSETRERVNYEFSETRREVLRPAGSVRRISVAILVNDLQSLNEEGGSDTQPRSEEELNDLKALVASAAGLDTSRGDEVTIRSMAFEPVEPAGVSATGLVAGSATMDVNSLARLGLLGLVALGLGIFVLRPILTRPPIEAAPQPPALTGTIEPGDLPENALPESDPAELPGPARPDPMERFRELIGERQDESIQVLQSWLAEKGEKV